MKSLTCLYRNYLLLHSSKLSIMLMYLAMIIYGLARIDLISCSSNYGNYFIRCYYYYHINWFHIPIHCKVCIICSTYLWGIYPNYNYLSVRTRFNCCHQYYNTIALHGQKNKDPQYTNLFFQDNWLKNHIPCIHK